MHQWGVKFDDVEKKSLKASPLTVIGALKVLVEDEEVERIKKRKKVEAAAVPRKQSLQLSNRRKNAKVKKGGLRPHSE